MDIDQEDKDALRALWLRKGGKTDNLREFYALARARGIQVSFQELTRFIYELGLLPEVEQRLNALWAERESSVAELLDRAREAKIPLTHAQASKYVREMPERSLPAFSARRQTGKAFANSLEDQWQADVIFMKTRPSGPFRYILYRVNSFSREIDAEPMPSNDSRSRSEALADMLERASVKPQTLFTDEGHEFTGWDVRDLLRREGIIHEQNRPRDYGNMAVMNAGIGALKKLIRTEATDKGVPWAQELPRLVRIRNGRPTDQGVKPQDVVAPPRASKSVRRRAAEAQFWLEGVNAENIQHTFAEQTKKKEALRAAGGARLPVDKEYIGERRRGPVSRGDDPKFGPIRRIADDFSFGQVRMDAGEAGHPVRAPLHPQWAHPARGGGRARWAAHARGGQRPDGAVHGAALHHGRSGPRDPASGRCPQAPDGLRHLADQAI